MEGESWWTRKGDGVEMGAVGEDLVEVSVVNGKEMNKLRRKGVVVERKVVQA